MLLSLFSASDSGALRERADYADNRQGGEDHLATACVLDVMSVSGRFVKGGLDSRARESDPVRTPGHRAGAAERFIANGGSAVRIGESTVRTGRRKS